MIGQENWESIRDVDFDFKYGDKLQMLEQRYDKGELVIPAKEYWNAHLMFPNIDDIKVIIIGDTPFRQWYASDGFAFSSLDPDAIDYQMRRLYDKLYYEIGVVYDRSDNSKQKWLDRGILCLPHTPLIYKNDKDLTKQLRGRSEDLLSLLASDDIPRAFVSLLSYPTGNIFRILNRAKENGHLVVQVPMTEQEFMKIPIFTAVNNFILTQYKTIIDWT